MSKDTLKVEGKITKILSVETGKSKLGKEWSRQSFVIDTGEKYNPEVCFGLFGSDKIEMLANYEVGKHVQVLFNVSSREFNGKYYHNLDCWKIQSNNVSTNEIAAPVEEDSDVPF